MPLPSSYNITDIVAGAPKVIPHDPSETDSVVGVGERWYTCSPGDNELNGGHR